MLLPSRDRQGASRHATSVIFIIAIRIIFSARSVNISKSFARRLKFPSQANVRSTIHRLGNIEKVSLIFNEAKVDNDRLKRWTRHGSTRYLWKAEDVEATIQYVVHEQGDPMAVFENKSRSSFAGAVIAP